MLGDFLTRSFVLVLGYAYPAFECYKTVEKNRVNIEELRFWCQYWIIAASMTVFERFGEVFVSWLPMYGEAKLALFIYLWCPKTKGCRFVYESIVRPRIAKHETDIDRSIQELRARGLDFVIYYWKIFAKSGQTKFFEALQYFASQSANMASHKTENAKIQVDARSPTSPPSPSSPTPISIVKKNIRLLSENNGQLSKKVGWPPMPPSSPTAPATTPTGRGAVARSTSAKTFKAKPKEVTTRSFGDHNGNNFNDMVDQNGLDHDLNSATLKLRRSKTSLQHK